MSEQIEVSLEEHSPAWWMAQCRKTLNEAKKRNDHNGVNEAIAKRKAIWERLQRETSGMVQSYLDADKFVSL